MATKRPAIVETVTPDMLWGLANVTFGSATLAPTIKSHSEGEYNGSGKLRRFLYNAALRFPDREFRFVRAGVVNVFSDGKPLGSVSSEYTRRAGEYVIRLANDRISNSLKKRAAVLISGLPAALRRFAADFDPKSADEYYEEAYSSASTLWSRRVNSVNGNTDAAKRAVEKSMLEFMWSDEGMEIFARRAKTKPDPVALDLLAAHSAACEARNPFNEAVAQLQAAKASFVKATQSGFLVRPTNQVSSTAEYAATDLPEMFANAYVLKMAPVDELLPGIGIRLRDDLFLVVHQS